jgi:hypothetical protein
MIADAFLKVLPMNLLRHQNCIITPNIMHSNLIISDSTLSMVLYKLHPIGTKDQLADILDSLRRVNHSNIRNSISSAGFSNDFKQWHIAKHDVYGNDSIQAWENSGDVEISPEDLELILQHYELKYE